MADQDQLELVRSRLERELSSHDDSEASDAGSSAVLDYRGDTFNGVIVAASRLPSCPQEFVARLTFSLEQWQREGRRGVWLKVPVERVEFVPLAVQQCGFTPHHATAAYFMLTRWLPSSPSPLPGYANSNVGVGGWVEDGHGRVLVVQERSGPTAGMDLWKLPGGMMECDESLATACVREVLEETGVACAFDRLLCFQQSGPAAFGVSSFYAICRLHPIGPTDIKVQESEIAKACWMPVDELLQKPYYQSGVFRTVKRICASSTRHPEEGFAAIVRPHFFRSGEATLFASPAAIDRAETSTYPPGDISSL